MIASTSCFRALPILLGIALFTASAGAAGDEAKSKTVAETGAEKTGAEWEKESSAKGVTIHSRLHEGSQIREFKAVGTIEATPATVFSILDDSESYPNFMPYTAECHVLKREKNSVVAYQRLEVPLVSDRDYTLRSQNAKWIGPDGAIYRIRWAPANSEGPAEKSGVARVSVCEGGWLLEPDGAGATRATYSIFTDSGGTLPPFIANNGSRIAIRKVFEAIRKRAKDPQFAAAAKMEPAIQSTN
ncbi:MAG: START domain-containing protein [Chthoniobacterales bacterium]